MAWSARSFRLWVGVATHAAKGDMGGMARWWLGDAFAGLLPVGPPGCGRKSKLRVRGGKAPAPAAGSGAVRAATLGGTALQPCCCGCPRVRCCLPVVDRLGATTPPVSAVAPPPSAPRFKEGAGPSAA